MWVLQAPDVYCTVESLTDSQAEHKVLEAHKDDSDSIVSPHVIKGHFLGRVNHCADRVEECSVLVLSKLCESEDSFYPHQHSAATDNEGDREDNQRLARECLHHFVEDELPD